MQIKVITIDVQLSSRAKAAIRWVLTPLAVLVGSAAVAHAWTTTNTDWVKSGNKISAGDLKKVLDEADQRLAKLESQVGAPSGTIIAYGGLIDETHAAPAGWELCDGRQINALDPKYAALYGAIGTNFGGNADASTFYLPDLRGRFLRGVGDPSKAPDADARTAMFPGGNSGAKVGSVELDATALPKSGLKTDAQGSHDHGGKTGTEIDYPGAGLWYDADGTTFAKDPQWWKATSSTYAGHKHPIAPDGVHAHNVTGGDGETRPKNAFVHFIIKL